MAYVDLSTALAALTLPTPVMTASGCGGSGPELDRFVGVADLGGFVTRSITLDSRVGWRIPRLTETASGVLHATGLQNPGLAGFLAGELPWLVQQRARVVVSITGTTLGEYAELASRIGNSPGVAALEVNLSGTHQDTSRRAAVVDPYQAAKVLDVVRRDVPRDVPILAKLAADAAIVDVARAGVKSGADGLVLVQGLPGLAIDPLTLQPALGARTGTLSGPAIHSLAVRCVWDVHEALPEVPLVGVGGIRSGFDALELLLAGASAVQVGSVLFGDPSAPRRIVDELRDELERRGFSGVTDVIGHAHRLFARAEGEPS